MNDFCRGLVAVLCGAGTHYRTRTPVWPLFVARDVAAFTWWRGVYWPLADEWNVTAWRHGLGAHRYRVRPGDVIYVHGTPNTVLATNLRKGLVFTSSGIHDLVQCCDPMEVTG